jgi:hypothetical protein
MSHRGVQPGSAVDGVFPTSPNKKMENLFIMHKNADFKIAAAWKPGGASLSAGVTGFSVPASMP